MRRPVGSPQQPTEAERKDAIDWATRRTNTALTIIWDDKRGCAYCHVTEHSNGNFTVAPVVLRARFLPEAQVRIIPKHMAQQCADWPRCTALGEEQRCAGAGHIQILRFLRHGGERADLKARNPLAHRVISSIARSSGR